MIFADTAAATTPDLTAAWIALLGVAIGAVITGLISWLAAERGHSAENDRWVREQRFEAIVRATRLTDRVRQLQTRTRDLHREAAAAGKAGTDVTGIIQELQKVNDESREMMRDVVGTAARIGDI